MIPGLFDGFFGDDALGKAAETALELCILEELERDAKPGCYDRLSDEEDDDT